MNRNLNNVLLYALLDEVRTSEHFRTYRIPKSGEAGTTGRSWCATRRVKIGRMGRDRSHFPSDRLALNLISPGKNNPTFGGLAAHDAAPLFFLPIERDIADGCFGILFHLLFALCGTAPVRFDEPTLLL